MITSGSVTYRKVSQPTEFCPHEASLTLAFSCEGNVEEVLRSVIATARRHVESMLNGHAPPAAPAPEVHTVLTELTDVQDRLERLETPPATSLRDPRLPPCGAAHE